MKFSILIIAYLAMCLISYAAMVAQAQHDCHTEWQEICDARMVREDKAFAIFASATPPGWAAVAVITGGYQDGFSLEEEPAIQRR